MSNNILNDVRKSQITSFFAGILTPIFIMLFMFHEIGEIGWQPWVITGIPMIIFGIWTDRFMCKIRIKLENKK